MKKLLLGIAMLVTAGMGSSCAGHHRIFSGDMWNGVKPGDRLELTSPRESFGGNLRTPHRKGEKPGDGVLPAGTALEITGVQEMWFRVWFLSDAEGCEIELQKDGQRYKLQSATDFFTEANTGSERCRILHRKWDGTFVPVQWSKKPNLVEYFRD